ncbi:MAG: hypothetical protein K1X28_06695 [Parachlamydiales bacterium]|nr:hypothetical protein [Parachlamydiales bacterium]
MVTVSMVNGEVAFESDDDFREAMKAGFFRIKAPEELDLESGRTFAKTFTSNPRYNQFGVLDVVNGYLHSEVAQTVRFTLERDHWNKCYVNLREAEGPPNYSPELQKLGSQMNEIGIQVIRSILKWHELPENLWFDATAGASHDKGSLFLLFNCYDPKLGTKPFGVGAHKDWGLVSILDVTDPGLEAKIDGEWRSLYIEDGYLIVNFGYVMEKLLPGVSACEHRVTTQKEKMRTSTVVFIDPRVGPYSNGLETHYKEGYVFDWDPIGKTLINGETTTSFFEKLSVMLYGKDQSGKGN